MSTTAGLMLMLARRVTIAHGQGHRGQDDLEARKMIGRDMIRAIWRTARGIEESKMIRC